MRVAAIRTLLLVLLAFAAPLQADDDDRREREQLRAAVQRGAALPLQKIIQLATARVPGEVIEVEIDVDDDEITYELKILGRSGRVLEVTLDARDGRILEIEDD